MRQLYKHQIEGKNLLVNNRQFGLFWDCGTMKTYTILSAIKELNKPAIVIATQSGIEDTWKNENKEIQCDLEMFNYTTFHKLTNKEIKNKILVFDEAHKISHADSSRSQQAMALTDYSNLWLMTGTAIGDKPIDLYMMEVLLGIRERDVCIKNHKEFDREFYRYRNRYAILKKKRIGWKKVGHKSVPRYVQEIAGWKNLDKLNEEIAVKSSSKKLEEIKDMPKATFIPVYFDLTPEEKEQYKEIKNEHIMKELQLCSEFSMKRVGSIVDRIRNESGKKTVIFSNFIKTVKYLAEELDGLELIGETKDRATVLNDFRANRDVLISTYKTGGESLNLQVAPYMIMPDLPQWLLELRQAIKRIYRFGQESPTVFWFLIPKGTKLEKVFSRLGEKFGWSKLVFEAENLDILNLMMECGE